MISASLYNALKEIIGSYKNLTGEELYEVENGKIKRIFINQNLIKLFFYKNEEIDFCPKYIRDVVIEGHPSIPTLSMLKGLYFEHKLIGTRRPLPMPERKIEEMIPETHLKRIQKQITSFPMICSRYGILIHPELVNCQVKTRRLFDVIDGVEVYVTGTADIITPLSYNGYYDKAIIDIKLTSKLDSPYTWGNPSTIDLTQAVLYSSLFEMPFFFLVFEYHYELRHRLIPVRTMYSRDPKEKEEGMVRQAELKEKIRQTAILMLSLLYDMEAEPQYVGNNCKICPLSKANGGTCNIPLTQNAI